MKNRFLKIVVFAMALAVASLGASRAQAANYYVSTTGNDANSGSSGSPWKTVQKAFSAVPANASHVINIGAGTFTTSSLLVPPAGTTVSGAGTGQTTIKSSQRQIVKIENLSNITLTNFSIDAAGQAGTPGLGSLDGGASKILINNGTNIKVLNVNLYNGEGIAIDIVYSHFVTVDGGYYKEAGGRGTVNGDQAAAGIGRSNDVLFKNVTIEDTDAQAFRGWSDQKNVTVTNCVFKGTTNSAWNNGGSGFLGVEFWGADSVDNLDFSYNYVRGALSLAANSAGFFNKIHIHHNELTQNYGIEMSMSNVEVDHNFVHDTGYAFADFSSGSTYSNLSFHHNVVYNTGGPSILIHLIASINGLKCYNNTVYTTDSSNRYVYVEGALSNGDFANNIFVSTAGAALNTYGQPTSNNLFQYSNPVGNASVVGDPKLVNINSTNVSGFALQSTSPAINRGKAIAGITTDVTDGSPDIGAFEYGKPLWVVGPQANTPTPTPTPAPGGNLLANPSFDADNFDTQTPSGWSEWNNADASYTEAAGGNHSGARHGGHWRNLAYEVATLQVKTGLANGNYTFRAWVRSGGGQPIAKLYAQNYGGAQMSVDVNTAIANWTLVTLANIPVSNGQCEVGFWSRANAGQWFAFDDAEFFKQAVASPIPIGKRISIKALNNNLFVMSDLNNGGTLRGISGAVGSWEKFDVVDAGGGLVALKSPANNNFVQTNTGVGGGTLIAQSPVINDSWQKFTWQDLGNNTFALKANNNGMYVQNNTGVNSGTLIAQASAINDTWQKFVWALAP